ncbi:putative inactive purple acid phosphatase 24 [Vitis vinifera]|uniref:Putative inactive purple acid phosphatase 24 n=1 Tax=Vitis vinifera TaxID=29760 RepID=A0A438EY37_VITVI|nr:putative inactive purple acid phosphatase 24 [Vitis vinifera]
MASTVPYMVASGNHERDWPNSGSYYDGTDSGGECGVPAETTFYFPAKNRSKFWYSADYGMFHFCVADTENDWRKGTEQYRFLEHCLASVDRRKQPWLIFTGHRVLGYSSEFWYALEGSYAEPGEGRACRSFGRSTRWILHYLAMSTTMKEYALFTSEWTIHIVVGGEGATYPSSLMRYPVGVLQRLRLWICQNDSGLDVKACVHDGCEPTTLAN